MKYTQTRKNHPAISIGITTLSYLIFALFFWGVTQHAGWIHTYDNTIYAWLKPLHPNATPFFTLYTKIGNPLIVSTLAVLIFFVLILRNHWRWGAFLGINMVLGNAINHTIKNIVRRPRPTLPHLVVETGFSFPSGHATTAVLLFGTLLLIGHFTLQRQNLRRFWIGAMIVMLLLLGISRLYVQVHYPSDVTAGFALALGNLIVHWLIARRTYLRPELQRFENR
ncbi:phosphatase PAP2 family protein [Lapidilactobacillus mulanensis]|uniref:Phosphatase PAP2 family protein n=1 Tax=Lapidilactobacillus mulanensis TaxID=2485999 RepID=A0ABW4DMG0_9LACO|nr:phosphatase PAP2 family protein [Lapidilactobacillus mulanensis]